MKPAITILAAVLVFNALIVLGLYAHWKRGGRSP